MSKIKADLIIIVCRINYKRKVYPNSRNSCRKLLQKRLFILASRSIPGLKKRVRLYLIDLLLVLFRAKNFVKLKPNIFEMIFLLFTFNKRFTISEEERIIKYIINQNCSVSIKEICRIHVDIILSWRSLAKD